MPAVLGAAIALDLWKLTVRPAVQLGRSRRLDRNQRSLRRRYLEAQVDSWSVRYGIISMSNRAKLMCCFGKWVSTGIAILGMAGWLLSGWRIVAWQWESSSDAMSIACYSGVAVMRIDTNSNMILGWPAWPGRISCTSTASTGSSYPRWHWRWVEYKSGTLPISGTSRTLQVPLWFVLSVASVMSIWMWRLCRDRHRQCACSKCGYDLSGTRTGMCPECGPSSHVARRSNTGAK